MLKPGRDGTLLLVRVVPGARKSGIVGEEGGRLKVRVAAPPVEDKANRRLLEYLGRRLGLKKRQLVLTRGRRSRNKSILLVGVAEKEAASRLRSALEKE